MGAVSDWAPSDANHLLRSTAIVPEAHYERGRVSYRTFEDSSEEVVRLTFEPGDVLGDRATLPRVVTGSGWTYDSASHVLRIRRQGTRSITIRAPSPRTSGGG